MRLRSFVLPAVVAAAVTVAIVPAQAAGPCSLVMPTKLVVNEDIETIHVRLADNCTTSGWATANWDVAHSVIDEGVFYADFADGIDEQDLDVWGYAGRYTAYGVEAVDGDGAALDQNEPVMVAKYASKIAATVTRTSTKLTWAATATQWSGNQGKNVVRAGVNIGLFHQASSTSAWISLTSPKSGNYRLKVAETPTVWAAYSSTIKGRV
jgi:hypothetical protein